jgi:transposase InsO family protein
MAQKVVAMETRLAVAIARRVDEAVSVTALASGLGISRQTFYVYQRRYEREGMAGLVPRSRAAHRHRNQVPASMEDQLVAKRKDLIKHGLDGGARSVWGWLKRAGQDPPSVRTVHRVFVRHGLVEPQPQKRPRSSYRRFEAAAPNGMWQLDGMDWRLADGSVVTVIRVIDDHSRKVFRSLVTGTESGPAAWACLQATIAFHGAPAALLSDNSLAFTGQRRKIDVAMQKELRQLGVAQIAATPGHPRTCGKAEREHRTLQTWLRAQPPARTMSELQQQIDVYDEIYNADRPHQGLDGISTPDERYAATAKAIPADHPLPPPPEQLSEVKVSARGTFSAGPHTEVQIGRDWEGVTVQVARHGNHVAVFHRGQLIYTTAIDPTRRYQPSGRPRTGKRLSRIQPAVAAAPTRRDKERPRCSARSAARTNHLDPDEARRTLSTATDPP